MGLSLGCAGLGWGWYQDPGLAEQLRGRQSWLQARVGTEALWPGPVGHMTGRHDVHPE